MRRRSAFELLTGREAAHHDGCHRFDFATTFWANTHLSLRQAGSSAYREMSHELIPLASKTLLAVDLSAHVRIVAIMTTWKYDIDMQQALQTIPLSLHFSAWSTFFTTYVCAVTHATFVSYRMFHM